MTDEQLRKLYLYLRKPIHWDPLPPWERLTAEQLHRYNEVQLKWNTKIEEIENLKVQELEKIMGSSLK